MFYNSELGLPFRATSRALCGVFPVLRPVLAVALAAAIAVAPARRVLAANDPTGKPQSVDVDQTRLGKELDLYAAEANRTRLATALTGWVLERHLFRLGSCFSDVPTAFLVPLSLAWSLAAQRNSRRCP